MDAKKLNKAPLLRISLFSTFLFLSGLQLTAQSGARSLVQSGDPGGYSNLEFIENKGQWDSSIRFNAGIATGNLFMQRNGFTALLHDTNDMKRIGLVLHGDLGAAGGAGGRGGKKGGGVGAQREYTAQSERGG